MHDQRDTLMGWLVDRDFDGFAYSPKDDPHHRDRWRDPYPDSELDALAELAGRCRDRDLDLVLSM